MKIHVNSPFQPKYKFLFLKIFRKSTDLYDYSNNAYPEKINKNCFRKMKKSCIVPLFSFDYGIFNNYQNTMIMYKSVVKKMTLPDKDFRITTGPIYEHDIPNDYIYSDYIIVN